MGLRLPQRHPTLTTIGNAAKTAEAWGSPLTPAEQYSPVAADRNYSFAWANSWFAAELQPGDARCRPRAHDVQAAIANLFVSHNRMHDFAYYLGFTETTWNLQDDNFGNTARARPAGGETTPSSETSRPARSSGGAPSYLEAATTRTRSRCRTAIPRDHQQVPVPADRGRVLQPVRRRRSRHLGRRARVHPRDLEPHGRRPRLEPQRSPGRRDGRVLVRPRRARSTCTSTASCPAAAATPWAVGAYVTGNKHASASATTRSTRTR